LDTVPTLNLPGLIAAFRQAYPGVEFRIRDGEQQEQLQGLTTGRFDLANLYEHDLYSTIETVPLIRTHRRHGLHPEGQRLAGEA
ncbi:LysR substrate-binding domain-containing protein, partial [Pseudomonas aeruginosa]|uniref:LysR substrate-binding domain-containing protein n=1 Tax=Pseudomonas aeruginosa TaxID=287 RepID=UPI003CC5C335